MTELELLSATFCKYAGDTKLPEDSIKNTYISTYKFLLGH